MDRQNRQTKMLTLEQEVYLLENRGLIYSVIQKQWGWIDNDLKEELYHEGIIIAMNAIANYDSTKGASLETYIYSECKYKLGRKFQALARKDGIYVPTGLEYKFWAANAYLRDVDGATIEEVERMFGIERGLYYHLHCIKIIPSVRISTEITEYADLISEIDCGFNLEDDVLDGCTWMMDTIENFIRTYKKDRDKEWMFLSVYEELTDIEIGELYGVSRERVGQILRPFRVKLRDIFEENGWLGSVS